MKKRTLVLCLTIALSAMMAITGTLAYLQDQDEAVNVMTLGSVYIDQIEQERNAQGELVDFTQNKPLYPAVGEIAWNDDKININGHDYNMFGEKLKNAVDKIITVKNTGKSDAYIRTIVAVEDPFTTVNKIGVNIGGTAYTQDPKWFTAKIDGVQYSVACFTYDKVLKPGEVSLPSFLQVYLNSSATNEDVALLGNSYDILALSQAVQTAGFDDAKTALDTAFGEVTEANVIEWLVGVTPMNPVSTAAELADAFAEGGTIVLTEDIELNNEALQVAADKSVTLDLGGKTLSVKNTEAKASSAVNNKGTLTISNGTITYEGVGDTSFGYGTNTINNSGKLIIDGANIVNTTPSGSSVAIDNSANADLTINSGNIKSLKNAIRLCPFGSGAINCTVNGGTISGARAIQIQLPSNKPADAPEINLTINGGSLMTIADDGMAVYSYSYGQSFANVTATINGGDFVGHVAFGGGNAKSTQENVTITNGKFSGKVGRYVEDDGTNNGWEDLPIGNGAKTKKITATDNQDLEDALNSVDSETIIVLANDITGNVEALQAIDKEVTIDGNGNSFTGNLIVNGKSAAIPTAGLIIKNVKFEGHAGGTNAAYIHLGKSGDSSTRYANHVTIENCTFDATGETVAAVRSYTGGDKNVTIKNCTVNAGMHSLMQVKNVDGLTIEDCKVYSKNGINLNASPKLEMNNCTFDVQGYAVRFGEDGNGNRVVNIKDSTLSVSNADEGDEGIIVFRSNSGSNSKVTLTNTTLNGTPKYVGTDSTTTITEN